MSFLRGKMRGIGIYGRRLKEEKPFGTASESIDPIPPHGSA